MVFTATRDSAGSHLSGDCTYEIRGMAVPSLWWDIAAFTADGEVMPSKTGRSGFSSASILAAPGGQFTVRLSPTCSRAIGYRPRAEPASPCVSASWALQPR